MAINNNIEDPKYRKKIYDFLSTNFADFKRTETDFYKKLDTDSNYAGQVYDVISQNYSDFGRPRAEFLELMLPSKKKELSEPVSPVGGEAGTSVPPSGFAELKPAKRQPTEVIKEPKVVGEDTLLARKMEREQRPVVSTTGVKLPAAPKVVAEEKAAERALAPKLPTAPKEDIGELEGLSNAIDRGILQGKLADMLALGQMPKREDIKEIARINKELTQIPSTGAYQRFNAAPDLKTAAKEFVDNPFEITSQLISESLSALVRHGYSRALAGAGTGAALGSLIPIPGISTAAGAGTGYIAGMGVAGYNLEMASSIMDSFREAGVDVTDEKSLTKAFDDPNTLRKAREFANKRAVPIAIFDMFSAGMGGKLLNKPAKTILSKVGRGAAEVGIQMGMAGAGETAAQLTAGQKINPTAILAEVIGEAGGGAPDIIVGTMIENKKNNQSIRKEAVRLDIEPQQLQDMLDISEASGEITDSQANEIKKEYEDIQKVKQAVPEEFKKNADVIEALNQKRQLEAKKQGLDPVFAKKIDDQIKALDTKIDDIVAAGEVAPEAAPEVPAAEEKTYRVEYFDPESRKMTHQMFATEAEGEAFKKTLTREQASQGVTSYFEKAPARGVGEVAPKAAPEVPAAPEIEKKSDADIEKRMQEIEESAGGIPSFQTESGKEYDFLEKEMEKREKASVFNVTLDKVNEAVDALIKKEKEMPNGYGAFIEMKDARETKSVANRYLNASELTESEIYKDFADAVMGNPDTWYADGLKLRESLKEASNRGIDTQKMVDRIVQEFVRDGFTEEEAKGVVARRLAPIFEGSQVAPPELPAAPEEIEEINAQDLRKNPNIKLDFTIGYPESFVSLGTDRETIARENNIDASSIRVGDEVVLNNKKYVVKSFPFPEKVSLIQIDENGKLLRNRDLKEGEIEEPEVPAAPVEALKDIKSTSKALEEKFNPEYKNSIVEKLSSFDDQIKNKKFPNVLEVAEKTLPRNIFNKYKSLYEIGARNNITVSNETLPAGLVAAWAFNNVQLNKNSSKYYLKDYNEFAETLNHEIIHGLISRGVRNQYALYNDLQSVIDLVVNNFDSASDNVKEIIGYIQDTRKEFTEKDIIGATDEELASGKYRETGSLEELITYAFTDSEFAKFLDSIPASKEIKTKGNTVFEQLKNIVRSIIGGLVKSPTALDEINSVLDDYFDTSWNESQIAERNKTYQWGLKFKADDSFFDKYENDPQVISKEYHKAKADGSNPELVKAVEGLFVGEVAPEAAPQVPVEKIKPIDFSTQLENKYGVSLDLTGNLEKGDLTLSKIVVPEEKRRQGIGTSVMEDIIKYADENGKRITLTPSEDFGAESIKNLTEFYKRFGFVENKGENKDFTIKDAMYRVPQPVTAEEQLKPKEYAVQKPTTGEIPVQPESRVSEKVEAGVPPTRPPKPPKEGEVEGETGAEKKSVELSLKGIKEIANEFSIEDVEGRTRKTDIELRENAKDKIDKWVAEGSYDKNIDNLVKKAEEFDVLTDEQRIILEQHLANVRENFSNGIENGTIKAGSEEFTNGLNQIKRLLDAASKTRSAAGAALRIPIGGSVAHPLENYDTALVAKMDANSVDKLTDAQIKEVEESVRLYKEKIDAANERIKDLEDKLSQMMAEEEVGSVKKRKKAIKSKEERVAERKQAIADAREALKKIRTGEAGLSAVPIPFVREFVAISPYVKKIAQSYIEEGVDNLNLLIDKIYEDFKDDLPEMTKKDVRDIIGNQYSQRKETATEAKSKLRDLTEEARLLSLYEKLLSGEEPVSERKKIERNQRIVELRNKINEIRKRNKEQDVDYKDLKRIEDTKNRALQKAKEYKKRLDEKDFATSEKPISIFNDTKLQKKYPKEYNEMLDAIQEREDAKHEFDIELMKDEERRQTKLQKIGRYAKMFTGTTKAIKSGIDASATLIQNFAMLSAYPKSFAKAFVNQWGDFASQKKFNRWHTAIKNNKPVWDLIQNSGLSITEPSALKEAQKEEIFSDNLLDRTFKIGDKTYNIGKYTTKPFERLFVSMGNALRVDVFLRIADKWYVEGKTFETNPEDYKSLANMLNNMTSRAKLAPAVERARDIVGTGIWSPQLMASRLNLLGISDAAMPFFGRKGYYAGLTPKVRKMQIANMAKMIGLGLSIMLLAKVSGSDDDEGDLDPVSPTFGTVKIGEKRIPVWSNYPKYIRTIAQFASGKQKIEGEYADKRRGETAQRFFRSSVPPATGTAIDIITGRDYMGKPITKEGIVKGLVMPMSLEAISKEVQRDGVLGAVTGAAQFFGLNVSDERDYVKKDDRPFDIKDPVTFKKREVTEKELEAFKKRRDEIYKELSDDYENGRKTIYLNPEDKIKLSIPSSVSDMELDSWRELYYEKLTPEQIKELYKLLMSKAKKDSKNELKLTLGEEEEKED